MRPRTTVVRSALAAALAIGALPGLVGSYEPSQDRPVDAGAFRQVDLATTRDRQGNGKLLLDAAGRSDGALAPIAPLIEPADGAAPAAVAPAGPGRPNVTDARPSWSWNPALYTLHGFASFYDHGTTAMRLPRGTVVVICGAGGCIERVITDYGPSAAGSRIIDMYRPDFFQVCGCGSWSGTTEVTIRVY
jgi:hypothetical protein